MSDPAIAVVGAGIGGLSCAAAFRRIGIGVRVYEQAAELGAVGAGIGLWRGAVKSLGELGVPEWFWALRKHPFRWAETAAPDGRVLVGFDVRAMTRDGPGFVARRADLHRALAEAAEGQQVVLGSRVTGVSGHEDGVTLRFADGTSTDADLVIGADGLNSVVRPAVCGLWEIPRYSGETCYRGMAEFALPDPDVLREVQGAGQRCAVHALDDEHVYWWATRRVPPDQDESAEQRRDVLTAAFAGWQFGFPDALAVTDPGRILKNDLYDRRPMRTWSQGRVTLLGDAAHPTTPNLGLGGCMAIEDSLVLARAFTENDGDHTRAFEQYESERKARTTRVVRMSAWFGRLGSVTNSVGIRARQLLMRATPTAVTERAFTAAVGFDPGPLRR